MENCGCNSRRWEAQRYEGIRDGWNGAFGSVGERRTGPPKGDSGGDKERGNESTALLFHTPRCHRAAPSTSPATSDLRRSHGSLLLGDCHLDWRCDQPVTVLIGRDWWAFHPQRTSGFFPLGYCLSNSFRNRLNFKQRALWHHVMSPSKNGPEFSA